MTASTLASIALAALLAPAAPGSKPASGDAGSPPAEPPSADRAPASPSEAPTPPPGAAASPAPQEAAPAAPSAPSAPGAAPAPAPAQPGATPPPVRPAQLVPLPPAPPPEPKERVAKGPWAGNFWFEMRADLSVPLGGTQPARGNVVGGGGTVSLAYRPHRLVGLRTGLGLISHDARTRRSVDFYGDPITVVDYGQLMSFEFLGLRAFIPAHPRFLPYVDVAGGMALWFPAGSDLGVAGGLGRAVVGFEGWVAPRLSIGLETGYRILWISGSLGHALQAAFRVGLHW